MNSHKESSQLVSLHRLSEPRWNLWISALKPVSLSGPTVLCGRSVERPLLGSTPTWSGPPPSPSAHTLGHWLPGVAQARGYWPPLSPWPVIGWRIGLWSVWANKTWGRGLLEGFSGTKASSLSWRISRSIFSPWARITTGSYLFLFNKLSQNLVALHNR